MRHKFLLKIKKPVFILVEGESEKIFFDNFKKKFNLQNIEIYSKSKLFFKNLDSFNKQGFMKIIGKEKQITKYQDIGNTVYVVFDKNDEYVNMTMLDKNIKIFGKNKFIKGNKDLKGEIDYFYSTPCFEKVLLVLDGRGNCFENSNCKQLKRQFYGKNRTDLPLIEKLFYKIPSNRNEILKIFDNYLNKCNVDSKDILFLLQKLL